MGAVQSDSGDDPRTPLESRFCEALLENRAEEIELLLSHKDLDVNKHFCRIPKQSDGVEWVTPLFHALVANHTDTRILEAVLITPGLDSNHTISGRHPIDVALKHCNTANVKTLLLNRHLVDPTQGRINVLGRLVQRGERELVEVYLACPDVKVDPCIRHALATGTPSVIEPLLLHKSFEPLQASAIHYCVMNDLGAALTLLLETCPSVDVNVCVDGETPLTRAAKGASSATEALLKRPDIQVNLATTATPLERAAWRGDTGIVTQLLAHPGIDVNMGVVFTPLAAAVVKNKADVVRLLVKHEGLKPNLLLPRGPCAHSTALFLCVTHPKGVNLAVLLALLELKATDPRVINRGRTTALRRAAELGRDMAVTLLTEHLYADNQLYTQERDKRQLKQRHEVQKKRNAIYYDKQ